MPPEDLMPDNAAEFQGDTDIVVDDVETDEEPETTPEVATKPTETAPDPEKEFFRKQAEAAEAKAREYEARVAEERKAQEQATAAQRGATYLSQKREQVIDAFAKKMAEKPGNEREALGTLVDQLIAVQAEVTAAQLQSYHENVSTQSQTQQQFLAQQAQRFLAAFGEDEERAPYLQPVTQYAAQLVSKGLSIDEAEYFARLRMDDEIANNKRTGKVTKLPDRKRPAGGMGESVDDASTSRGGGSVDEDKFVAQWARRLAGLV